VERYEKFTCIIYAWISFCYISLKQLFMKTICMAMNVAEHEEKWNGPSKT